jgi:hypothetical protein
MIIIVEFVEMNPDLLEEVNKALLLSREQHWLDWLFSLDDKFRYNFLPTAGSPLLFRIIFNVIYFY